MGKLLFLGAVVLRHGSGCRAFGSSAHLKRASCLAFHDTASCCCCRKRIRLLLTLVEVEKPKGKASREEVAELAIRAFAMLKEWDRARSLIADRRSNLFSI